MAIVRTRSNLPWRIRITIVAFSLLKDGATFRRSILTALPHRARLRVHRLFEDLNATLAGYIRAQLLACALVGGLCGLGFAVLGIQYPLLLGVLAGVLGVIPLVGPLLVALGVALIPALHAPALARRAIAF